MLLLSLIPSFYLFIYCLFVTVAFKVLYIGLTMWQNSKYIKGKNILLHTEEIADNIFELMRHFSKQNKTKQKNKKKQPWKTYHFKLANFDSERPRNFEQTSLFCKQKK